MNKKAQRTKVFSHPGIEQLKHINHPGYVLVLRGRGGGGEGGGDQVKPGFYST